MERYFGPDVPSTYGNECVGEARWPGLCVVVLFVLISEIPPLQEILLLLLLLL
jgi:hypothetical protein